MKLSFAVYSTYRLVQRNITTVALINVQILFCSQGPTETFRKGTKNAIKSKKRKVKALAYEKIVTILRVNECSFHENPLFLFDWINRRLCFGKQKLQFSSFSNGYNKRRYNLCLPRKNQFSHKPIFVFA